MRKWIFLWGLLLFTANLVAQIRLDGTTAESPMALDVGESYLFPTNYKVAHFTFMSERDGVLYLDMSESLQILGSNENVSGVLPQFGCSCVLGVEAYKLYQFQNSNTWSKSITMEVSFVEGTPYLPVQSNDIIPASGSVYRTTEKDGDVSFYFNVGIDASKVKASVVMADGESVVVEDVITSEDYKTRGTIYIIRLAETYNRLLDEGQMKAGESFQVVLKNVVDKNNPSNEYPGEIVVDYVASARATKLTRVTNMEKLKSYYYPGSGEGIIELMFSEVVTCGADNAILSYGDREKNTWTELPVPYTLKGNVIELNLQGILMNDVPANDEGKRYVNISLKGICDKEGYPVEGNSVGSSGSVSLSYQVELVDVKWYQVTYILDGVVYKVEKTALGAILIPPMVSVEEGYLFNGWQDVPGVMPSNNLTIYGTTSIRQYQLTYVLDNVVYKTETVEYGKHLEHLEPPLKKGYTFGEWQNAEETMPAHDLIINGEYSINSYTLLYLLDGDEYRRMEVSYGTPLVPIESPTKVGHTFGGWSEMPETMPDGDVTVVGGFSVNNYTLLYLLDGDEYKRMEVSYGTPLVPIEFPSKVGHTFSGWSEMPETMPDGNVTVVGGFSVNSYTLLYLLDGDEYKRMEVAYGTPLVPIESPSKVGHTFSGWSEMPETMPDGNVTVVGGFSVNNYTLLYLLDGDEYKRMEVAYGTPLVPIESPSKVGHTFSGWSEMPETMPDSDVTVEGSFSPNTYMVTYILEGVVIDTRQVAYGTNVPSIEVPEKDGYLFTGWIDMPQMMPANDLTLSGTYVINKEYLFDLIYVVDGVEYSRITLLFGTEIVSEPCPETKVGHTFSGWSEIPKTMPFKDVVVEGFFIVNKHAVTYYVDGEIYTEDSVAYGTPLVPIEFPSKVGHTFSGWSEMPETMPDGNVTVEGGFSVNSYTLLYLLDGDEYKRMEVAYGTPLVPIESPSKVGHTFSGWSEIPATMPAYDCVVEGSFIKKKYLLTYLVDGEVYATDSIMYGDLIEVLEPPIKEGYVFSGWDGILDTMPAYDVYITGAFEVNAISYGAEGRTRVDIYTLQGILVGKDVEIEGLDQLLGTGVYVIVGNDDNHRTIIVK